MTGVPQIPETADTLEAIVLNHARATFLSRPPKAGSVPIGSKPAVFFFDRSLFFFDAGKWMWYDIFIPRGVIKMKSAVKKTISLPSGLAKEVEEMAREEGKPVSAVIQDALRLAKRERLKRNFYQAQNYWSCKAKEKGILTERDLERYLKP